MPGVSVNPSRTTDMTTASAAMLKDPFSRGQLAFEDQQ